MSNERKSLRVLGCLVLMLLALAMTLSACMFPTGDTSDPSSSIVSLVNKGINTGYDRYLNSAVMYRLPATVKETDEISVIIQTKSESLLDAYEKGGYTESFTEYAHSAKAAPVSDAILAEKNALLSAFDKKGFSYETGADYKAILGGFEVVIKAGDFDELCDALGDRATAIVGEEYEPAKTQLVENVVDVYNTGIFDSSDFEFDGTGTVVAVLDTGLDYNHSAFSVDNFTADRGKLGMTYGDVESFVANTKAGKLHAGLTASDVYLNEKVPFAFDYADGDPDVYPMTPTASEHGTHVAGVIAGKDDVITGVAPNAQLAIMKIFSDVVTTARTSWILSALEDCVVLGVDVINMSIGTSCGFSREMDKEAESRVYDRIRETGISMVVAASNSFNSTYGSEKNGNLGLTSNPDSATVGSPSTYEGAMSVASISGTKTPYLLYNDTIIYFTESTDRVAEEKSFYDDVLPKGKDEIELEYVTIPGVGRSADYAGLDVKGKIVLVRRGATTFEEKANVAEQKGAVGIIIYNNVSGEIKMNVGDAKLGAASIGQDDGELLAKEASGTIKLSRSQTSGPFMSDFSSWGPTPDLGIKPEITAHGGMIYSAVPGQSYDRQSGTSMASPNVAGLTALIRQYVCESFPEIANDSVKVTALVNQLMMSTADIVFNTNGLPYAVRKQGAGLASLSNIVNTDAYILTYRDGVEMDKTKLELGDDPKRTGNYTMTFAVKNFGATALAYDLSAFVMSEGVSETKTQQGETTVDELGVLFDDASVTLVNVKNGTKDGMRITVGAGKTAEITVKITLSEQNKKYLDESFENGMYVEGFVVLDAVGEKVVDLSVPYLAFYGDWTEAPLFDLDYYATNKDELDDGIDLLDKTLPDAYATRPIGSVESDYVSFLGSFYFVQDPAATPIAADRKYISLSNQEGAVHELSNVWAGLLRNAERMEITITEDSTGEVIFEKVENDIRKSYGDGGPIYPADIKIGFDAYEQNLKNNATYTVRIKGYLDYGDGGADTNDCNVFEFPLTADFQAPAVTDCEFYTEYDRTAKKTRLFAKMAVYDNHYTMALQTGYVAPTVDAQTGESSFELIAFDQYLTSVYSEKNATSYVVYELTDYVDEIRRNSYNPNSFTVAAYDYALNIATYEIRLPDDFLALYFEEESITLSPNQVYTLAPLCAPDSEWTELLTYSSSNKRVAQVVNNKLVAIAPGETVIMARDPATGLRATVNVVVLSEEDDGYVRYDKPVADSFELTGYLTNKAYYFVSTDDRDIGTTGDEMKFAGGNYSLSMFPSETVTLRYHLEAYFPEDTEVVAVSGNESLVKVEKVNGEWVITAHAEGYATVSVDVLLDGEATFYSQTLNIEVKDPFITTGPSLTHYFGLGGKVTFPETLAITDIGQFAFSNFDYVAKDPAMGDEISEEDPTTTKQWFLGDDTITEVVIPEGVETIGSYAFANLTKLEKVTLPSTLVRIEFGAFMGCTSLKTVKGIENVKFINRSAFEGCRLSELKLDNVVAIADRAFAGNAKLTKLTLGKGLQSIGAYAFSGDAALSTVTVNSPTVKLGAYAFDRCESLAAISINSSVIPEGAFNECKSLKTITLGKDVSVIGAYAFSNVPAMSIAVHSENPYIKSALSGKFLTDVSGKVLLLAAPGLSGEVDGSSLGITEVGVSAFSGNLRITAVKLPSVTRVADYAFAHCDQLAVVTLGTLTEIGDYAFYRTAIGTLPSLSGLSELGAYAFAHTALTEVHIPAGMKVGASAFRECKQLATVTVGNDAVLGADVFRLDRETNFAKEYGTYRASNGKLVYYHIYTSALHSLTIGDRVTVGDGAFYGASELETATVGRGVKLGAFAFYNAVKLSSFDFGGVISIGASAFSGDVLNEFLDQNMSEPYIGEDRDYVYRFYAPALTALDLSGVSKIGEDAFAFCRQLTAVKLGTSITEIPARAFSRCTSLSSINLEAVKTVGKNAFEEAALTAANLSGIQSIGNYAFVNAKELASVTFSNAWVTVGEGAFSYCEKLATLKNTARISDVGAYAFAYTAIKDIDLSGARRIGDGAFLKESITDLTLKLGKNLAELGENPFAYCRLEAFESTVTEEFNGQTLTSKTNTFDIGKQVRVIDGMLYRVVPNGLELVSFAGDAKNVTVADGTVRISALAFAASDVNTVVLPTSLYAIGHKAFYDCDALATIVFTSLDAPVLEEEYDYAYWLSAENLPAMGDYQYQDSFTGETVVHKGLGIVPYFMWNATDTPTVIYYGANFTDYVGRVDEVLTMVKPVNGKSYDSFVWNKYFKLSVDGAAVADETTLAAIDAIAAIPESVTLADREIVAAARSAYDRITSFEQRALVTNLSVLEAAEKRIKDLDFIANGEGNAAPEQTPPEEDVKTDEEQGMTANEVVIIVMGALGAVLVAAVVVLAILYIKAKRKVAPAKEAHSEEIPAENEPSDDETV